MTIRLRSSLLFALSCLFIISTNACAKANCDGSLNHPCVVQDTTDDTKTIKNYRDAQMVISAYKGNVAGLDGLWLSASAAPSEHDLKTIADNIETSTHNKVKRIIDLDLREESHAYLNGEAITLNSDHNWINKGKTHQQSVADEETWMQAIAQMDKIDNVLTAQQFKDNQFDAGVTVKVKSVQSEKKLAEDDGYEYIRLTVTDHMRPNDIETDRFVSLIKTLPKNTWLYLHCRGGEGRSTTFMAMYDMLQNADKVSFDDIIKRQASVEPYYDLFHTEHKDPDKAYYYRERLIFLQHFYQFASDYRRGYEGSWSTWVIENHVNPTSPDTGE